MTEEELDRLQGLCDAASPGPWMASKRWMSYSPSSVMVNHENKYIVDIFGGTVDVVVPAASNMALCIAARNSLPALIAEVRLLRAQLDRSIDENDRLSADIAILSQEINQ